MRIQCCICSDLFDHDVSISGLPCGHTFHEACLSTWLGTSKTCPHCRNKVNPKHVYKLFFDKGDEDGPEEGEDSDKMRNEMGNLKLAILQRDKEKDDLLKQQEELQDTILKLETAKNKLRLQFREEQATTATMKKQLAYAQLQQEDAQRCKDETKKIRKKLHELVAVEQLIKGSENDIQTIMDRYGNGENTAKELAMWCSVITKELNAKKQDNRSLRDELEKIKKDLALKKTALRDQEKENTSVHEQLKHSEDDLKHAERKIASLHKKLKKLQESLDSPSETGASFAHRLINESPAPSTFTPQLGLKPTLTSGLSKSDDGVVDLDTSMDLFSTPGIPHKRKSCELRENEVPKFTLDEDAIRTQGKRGSEEYGTQYIKIKSAADNPKKKVKRDPQDISNVPNFGNFNLFKAKPLVGAVPSIVRNGYNGFGGHEKFVQPTSKPRFNVKKPTRNPGIGKVMVNKKDHSKAPPLPSLDGFICLD